MTRSLFDLNDPAVIADPYPYYARLREATPVYHSVDPDVWLLSRHADVAATVRVASRFSSDLSTASSFNDNPFNPTIRFPSWLAAVLGRVLPIRTLLTSDPPEHTTPHRKVSRAFTPRGIAAWEPRIRDIAQRLIDDIATNAGREPITPNCAGQMYLQRDVLPGSRGHTEPIHLMDHRRHMRMFERRPADRRGQRI